MTTDSPNDRPIDLPANTQILVVDDDESNRESLSRRLRRRGATVDVAADGTAALIAIEDKRYDLVLLDVMMPGLSGIDVLQRVRQSKPPTELPVIMATANDDSADIARAFELGANDYVTKPIDFTVAFARVKTQLDMGRAVRQVLELQQNLSVRNAELENAMDALRRSTERTQRDLELAARVQATFLPRDVDPDSRYRTAWRYLPCEELAGDALNVCPLGPHHVAFYVLDVTGHGVASSLTAVTAARMLAPSHDPASILIGPTGVLAPASIMAEMASRFSFDAGTGQFITCFYALLDTRSGLVDYVSAGHPDAIVVPTTGPPRLLAGTGLPVGLCETYEQQTTTLHLGDRVWLYSDGVTEAMRPDGVLFGLERLTNAVASLRDEPLDSAPDALLRRLNEWREGAESNDDVSILVFEPSSFGR
ncbi:MAG: serine phosphatase RsbU, regulator of sigma subunit [Phycisphaerales bacterium]|nr:serine phosphatase RsbU, regulator of sigma subunit [Phycisphaerales bacterium]